MVYFLTTFAKKLRQRSIAEAEKLLVEMEARRLDLNGKFADFFLDKINNKFMGFTKSDHVVSISEFKFAKIMKNLKNR